MTAGEGPAAPFVGRGRPAWPPGRVLAPAGSRATANSLRRCRIPRPWPR